MTFIGYSCGMPDWIQQLHSLLTESVETTMITVLSTQGSVPRKIGARMLLSADRQCGTIGGGNLEFSAVKIARDRQLAKTRGPYRQIFALGPSLGQCCGGSVELLFETITRSDAVPGREIVAGWYCRKIDEQSINAVQSSITKNPGAEFSNTAELKIVLDNVPWHQHFRRIESAAETWVCDRLVQRKPLVVLFGAGHVGEALVAQLSLLACEVLWVDERREILPLQLPESITAVQSDFPADEVSDAPDDACFIVMTHSHATDFDICKAILEKQRFAFLGLIGSMTKRNTFSKRLKRRGIDTALIERLCCPIGVDGIRSNEPPTIALGVAAQLTMLWETDNRFNEE